jgi:DNA-binding MarR family transcriptional regulator
MVEPEVAPSDLAEVGSELCVILGRFVRRLRQGHETGELTLSELSVLARLDRWGPLPAGLLAEQERIRPQAMSVIVAALEERGLVTRAADPDDARRFSLSATPAGRELLAGRRSVKARRVAEALEATLTAAERRRLVAALPLLDRVADGL